MPFLLKVVSFNKILIFNMELSRNNGIRDYLRENFDDCLVGYSVDIQMFDFSVHCMLSKQF